MAIPSDIEELNNIIMTLSSEIGVNFYNLEESLSERSNIDILDNNIFNILSGLIINLTSSYRKTSIKVLRENTASNSNLQSELVIITKYLSTLLVPDLFSENTQCREQATRVMLDTIPLWTREFSSIMHLIIIFDYERSKTMYRNLAYPLSELALNLLHSHFKKEDSLI